MKSQTPIPKHPSSPRTDENPEPKDPTIHTLNKVKMKPLLTYLWTNLEEVLVDMPCEFKADSQKKYRNGFLVITYGAVYIFKNKFLVAPPPTFCLTLLDCRTVTCDEKASTITLLYADLVVTIKVKEAVKILHVMAKIVAECTFGLQQYLILPRFQIEKDTDMTIDKFLEIETQKPDKKQKSKGRNEVNPTTDTSTSENSNSPKSQKETPKEENPNANNKENENENQSQNTNQPQQPQQQQGNDNKQTRRVRFGIPHDPYSRSGQMPLVNTSSHFYCGSDEDEEDFDTPDCERIHLTTICTKRPKNALLNRCLFLAHFYDKYGRHIDEGCRYLNRYDQEPLDEITIGPHFYPNKFSLSYGHAIGWETNLKRVMFYHFKPMEFGHLLESIMINSINITQVCFIDYKYSDKPLSEIKREVLKQATKRNQKYGKNDRDQLVISEEESDDEDDESSSEEDTKKKTRDYFDHYTSKNRTLHPRSKFPIYIPDFSFYKVKSTNVTSFWFHDCDYPVISSFFEALEDYVCPIEEFEITSCAFNPTQLGQIFKDMSNLECFTNLKTFAFLKNDVKAFPIDSFQQFLSIACSLETIDISESEIDGSQIFAALCQSHSPVKSVKLSGLQFHTLNNMSTLTIPPSLIHADFSNGFFAPQAFKDMLLLLTNKKTSDVIPNCDKVTVELANSESSIMVCFAKITMKREGYEVFNEIDGLNLYPNICEFDWSNNKLPANCVNKFFRFLDTQTKMRILIMNNIKLEKQSFFFRRLLKYIMKHKLPGLDMRAKLYRKYGVPFYESLKKATFLRKLGVVIRNGSDEVMNKFNELIKMLPMLTELKADGFLPHTQESLINLWTTIIEHPTLCANDIPRVDLLYLAKKRGLRINDQEFLGKLRAIKADRKTPSTMQQRTDYVLQQIRTRNINLNNNNSIITAESDFFVASCSTPWIDSTPHSRLETLESESSYRQNDMVQPLVDIPEEQHANGTEPPLLNIGDESNEEEIYNMQCIPADAESSTMPTPMPSSFPDEGFEHEAGNQAEHEINQTDFKLTPTEFPPLDINQANTPFKQDVNQKEVKDDDMIISDGEKVDDDEFDDQSLEVDETESDNDNDNDNDNSEGEETAKIES